MDEIKQKFQTLENAFAKFIKELGGEVFDELDTHKSNKPKNADYIFRKENTIAELKRLDKDYYQTNDDFERLVKKIQKAIDNGYISESELIQYINEEREPEKFIGVILSDVRRTVENIIRNAEHQIKRTREEFKMPKAKGLLLLANDKSYFTPLTPLVYVQITEKLLLERANTSIDGFVYFTTNKHFELPEEKSNGIIWMTCYLKKDQKEFADFIYNLGLKWGEFVRRETNGRIKNLYEWNEEEINEKLESLTVISPK